MKIKSVCLFWLASSVLMATNINAETISSMATGEQGVPATYAKFQPILSESKLQISDPDGKSGNKKEVALDSNFTDVMNDYFYVDKGSEVFVFKMSGNKMRNELRVKKNFRTDLPDTFYRLSATLEPIDPMESVKNSDFEQNEITYLQVHNKGLTEEGEGYIPHPLLRIVWKKDAEGITNHYWAIVKNNAVICKGENGAENKDKPICKFENAYKRYDLGAVNNERPTDFDIIVGNQTLLIKVDGETRVEHNIDYWKHLLSYFKAGVYNQFSHGTSEAHFYKLEYSVDSKAL